MTALSNSEFGQTIGLAEMIESLRRELQTSLEAGKDATVGFDVEKVELELKVALSRKAKGEGGIAFWVLKAGASAEEGRDNTHTFKLTLAPVLSTTSARLRVNADSKDEPQRN